jgi:hypothetical protein
MSRPDDPEKRPDAGDRRGPSERSSRSGGVSDWMKALRDVAPYLDLGWRLAGAAAFPPLLGYAVDAWLGTLPWGVLVGAGVGLASALLQLRRLQEELDR